jgi:hypothetical protein
MQPNRVWIAVLLVMFFAVSLTITAEAQESGTPNDTAWQRADKLLKKLTLDEKLQLILSKYPSRETLHKFCDRGLVAQSDICEVVCGEAAESGESGSV